MKSFCLALLMLGCVGCGKTPKNLPTNKPNLPTISNNVFVAGDYACVDNDGKLNQPDCRADTASSYMGPIIERKGKNCVSMKTKKSWPQRNDGPVFCYAEVYYA